MSKSLLRLSRRSPQYLGQLKSELVTCAICLESLDNPRSLPCLHTFCQKCLVQTLSAASGDSSIISRRTFNCPTCRKPTDIPPGKDVKAFPKDFRTSKLLEHFERFAIQASVFACGFCDENRANLWQCSNCDDRFCQSCLRHLHSGRAFENHLTFRVWQPMDVSLCRTHQKTVTHFCTYCNIFLCVLCIQEHDSTHDISETHLALSQHQGLLAKRLKQLQRQHVDTTEALFQTGRKESKLREMNDESKRAIQTHCSELINAIRIKEKELLDQVTCETSKCSGLLLKRKRFMQTRLQRSERLTSETMTILMNPDSGQTLELTAGLLAHFKEEASEEKMLKGSMFVRCVKFTPGFGLDIGLLQEVMVPIDVQNSSNATMSELNVEAFNNKQASHVPKGNFVTPSNQMTRKDAGGNIREKSLNQYSKPGLTVVPPNSKQPGPLSNVAKEAEELSIKKCARLKCVIQGYGQSKGQLDMPFSACFIGQSEILVGELGNRRLQMFTVEGKHLQCLLEGQILPRCILPGGQDNKVVVTDEMSKSLKIVNVDCNESELISLKSVAYPYGIGMLKNGDCIVSDKIFGTVSRLSKEGRRTSVFGEENGNSRYFLNPSFLHISDADLVYITDTGNHEIKVYNTGGKLQFKIGGWGTDRGQFRYPTGIAICDDILFIVDSGNDRVVQITKDGVPLGNLLDKDMGIYQPAYVCVDKSGTLMAVTLPSRHEVRIYDLCPSFPVAMTMVT